MSDCLVAVVAGIAVLLAVAYGWWDRRDWRRLRAVRARARERMEMSETSTAGPVVGDDPRGDGGVRSAEAPAPSIEMLRGMNLGQLYDAVKALREVEAGRPARWKMLLKSYRFRALVAAGVAVLTNHFYRNGVVPFSETTILELITLAFGWMVGDSVRKTE